MVAPTARCTARARLRIPREGRRRMRALRHLLSSALVLALAVVGLIAMPERAAAAEERYSAPSSGYWNITGRGWGHGIGMSQWGALGAAQQGRGYAEILDFYYPGTSMSTLGNSLIRVALTAYTPTASVTLSAPAGQKLSIGNAGQQPAHTGTGRYSVVRTAAGYVVERRDKINGPVRDRFTLPGKDLEVSSGDGAAVFPRQDGTDGTWYRGTLRLVGSGNVAGAFDVVNHLTLEDYLRGVVPRESPSGWHAEALKAQAVAARSYALTEKKAGHFDTCDTTQCQVYGGRAAVVADGVDFKPAAKEAASTDAAIRATAGQVRWHNGAVAFTQFSSTNGGYSVKASNPTRHPYLVARPDPWTGTARGDSRTSWSARLNVGTVQAQCPPGGTLRTLVITGRDGNGPLGGRITGARVECSNGSKNLASFTLGMLSRWWKPTASPEQQYGFFLNDAWTTTANHVFQYGRDTDEVLVGDWDGDGADTLMVRRGATFYVSNDLAGGNAEQVFTYGRPGETILVGDWDGDGVDTLAVRRGAQYFIKNSMGGGGADAVITYGRAGDTVLVGDWDGNGTDTLTVRRGPEYHVKNAIAGGRADQVVVYGRGGDAVVVGDWDGNGTDTLAVRRGAEYHVKNSISAGPADRVLVYGRADDVVLVGDWNGDRADTLGVRRLP
ncbi:SpoIID/LytB domain-containing protein [Georgenia yuyongxinii]|uniref:SpoIID/LytB domain-containing protein n=2 Tax=Georgenia yuyongxinii TaxID=2589797 RepID=A0A5B8C5T0_9MICO|nr:SpoIID/LytB domain-containing protein [Georgenia yuyongxinii]